MKIKQVKKFKINDDGCIIIYIDDKGTEVSLKAKEQPLDSLIASFANLDKYVIDICELHEDAVVEVTGLSISATKEILGAVIIAKMSLQKSSGVLNLVTPHRVEEHYSEFGDSGQLMPKDMANHIREAITEIEKYISGERAGNQQELAL